MAYNSGVNFSFLRNVALKGLAIFLVLSLLIGLIPADALGRVSVYNHLVPGRARLPFGETPQRSYNLSLYNLEAMFASHEVSRPKAADEFRVVVLGDSSIWGTLLRSEETLAGRLNARGMTVCGRNARFYNLGYPTFSLAKDVLILDRVLEEKPDLVIWSTTLEAFPVDKLTASPLAQNNRARLQPLLGEASSTDDQPVSFLANTLFGRRRELADWARLQLYGIPWAATGIDQDYPSRYPAADNDLEADTSFHGLKPGDDLHAALAWNVLEKGLHLAEQAGVPLILVNEPVMISNGENSDIRYNFYYPRWAYDAYREELNRRADAGGWIFVDAWDVIDRQEFTNSAIHFSPAGVGTLAEVVSDVVKGQTPCR